MKMRMIPLFGIVYLFLNVHASIPKAQAETVESMEFSSVVQVDGVNASDLYVRAKIWFADSFVDSKNVLEVEDKDAGILIGKGSIAYEPNVYMSSGLIRGHIRFTIKVMVKDGRYK